jgi:hypothetical protein
LKRSIHEENPTISARYGAAAVLSLLVSATAFAASVPDFQTSDFYVNDYVGVLSGDTKSDIVSKMTVCIMLRARA